MEQDVIRLFIANTDLDWFDFLAGQPSLDEVNFWRPSGKFNFGAIAPGELFVFRLKSPRDVIGGYGVFSHASLLPISLAWEAFGVKNGAASLAELRARVGQYRGNTSPNHEDYVFGCRILIEPVFLPEHLWIPLPASWSHSIMQGKTYSTEDRDGRELWERLMEASPLAARPPGFATPAARYGEPTLVKPRLGQGAFRIAVTDAYDRTCAVSRGKVLPALDAAHIMPYADGGTHEISNGILLRRDIHSVFDAGYVTIDKHYRFVVSERVKTEFNNGNEYRRLHGTEMWVPANPSWKPNPLALDWHNVNRFRG